MKKIIKKIEYRAKKIATGVIVSCGLIVGLVMAGDPPSQAADTYNANNSAGLYVSTYTATNLVGTSSVVSGTTRGVSGNFWTNSIIGSYTNLTLLAGSGSVKDLAVQFQANIVNTNASAVTVVWVLARNLSGSYSTNQNGSPLLLDYFAQVTNTIPVNNTASQTLVYNLTSLQPNSSPTNVLINTTWQDGGIPNFYVYSVTFSAGVGTNSTVYAQGL